MNLLHQERRWVSNTIQTLVEYSRKYEEQTGSVDTVHGVHESQATVTMPSSYCSPSCITFPSAHQYSSEAVCIQRDARETVLNKLLQNNDELQMSSGTLRCPVKNFGEVRRMWIMWCKSVYSVQRPELLHLCGKRLVSP